MKIKSLFALFSIFTFSIFISCNDDINDIGQSIQPPSDDITVSVDTIPLQARTIAIDSIYARTVSGVLGEYEDDIFGTIKSDYLCQFYFPKDTEFKGTFKSMDSVQVVIDYSNYTGDQFAVMGLSLYEVTSPLARDYYTNIDPTKYSNMEKSLAQLAYSVSSAKEKRIVANIDMEVGYRLQKAWADGTAKDPVGFNKVFPGIYVTTNFGSGSLLQVAATSMRMQYTYTYVKDGAVRDSTGYVYVSAAEDVIQLNRVQNKNPEQLFQQGSGATYLKTPAGVYTEVTFPIGEIAKRMKEANMSTINSAQFSLRGYTELESTNTNGLTSPSAVLLVNKDSLNTFFESPRPMANFKTTFYVTKSASNTYDFGNITALINEYKSKNVDKVVYYVVPVEITFENSLLPNRPATPLRLSNYMMPGSAILRNDRDNMKLDLVYSKF